jgi:hypothetical protein
LNDGRNVVAIPVVPNVEFAIIWDTQFAMLLFLDFEESGAVLYSDRTKLLLEVVQELSIR